jgi:hypothetical protein
MGKIIVICANPEHTKMKRVNTRVKIVVLVFIHPKVVIPVSPANLVHSRTNPFQMAVLHVRQDSSRANTESRVVMNVVPEPTQVTQVEYVFLVMWENMAMNLECNSVTIVSLVLTNRTSGNPHVSPVPQVFTHPMMVMQNVWPVLPALTLMPGMVPPLVYHAL